MVQDGQGQPEDVSEVEDMNAENVPVQAESRSKALVAEAGAGGKPGPDKAVVAEHAGGDQESEGDEEYEYEETEQEGADEPEESKPDEEEARRNREELVIQRRERAGGDGELSRFP